MESFCANQERHQRMTGCVNGPHGVVDAEEGDFRFTSVMNYKGLSGVKDWEKESREVIGMMVEDECLHGQLKDDFEMFVRTYRERDCEEEFVKPLVLGAYKRAANFLARECLWQGKKELRLMVAIILGMGKECPW